MEIIFFNKYIRWKNQRLEYSNEPIGCEEIWRDYTMHPQCQEDIKLDLSYGSSSAGWVTMQTLFKLGYKFIS